MAQQIHTQTDAQTGNDALVGKKIIGNYEKVKRSYKKILKRTFEKNEKLEISQIYDEIIKDLKWDIQKRPSVRQLVAKYKKEISNEQIKKSEK